MDVDARRRFVAWLDLVGELVNGPPVPLPTRQLSRELGATFGTTAFFGWMGVDSTWGFELLHPPAGWPRPELLEAWHGRLTQHPLVRWFEVSGDDRPQTTARVPADLTDDRVVQMLRAELEPIGLEHQLAIPLELGAGRHRSFVVARGGQDFSDTDLDLAHRLQPLLALVDRQASVHVHDSPGGRAAEQFGLTGRQSAVLALLTDGLTAESISRRLGTSPRTVHKHIEHVYRKLGVRDRLSAIRVVDSLRSPSLPSQPTGPGRGVLAYDEASDVVVVSRPMP